MTTNVDRLEEEWKKRGYHLVPDSISDLDLDYEAEREAEKNNQWTITILKDEADLFLKHALSFAEQAGIARGREFKVDEVMGLVVRNSKGFDTVETKRLWMLDIDAFKADLSALTTEEKV